MFLRLPFNPSQKHHLVIGLSIAVWIYFFLVFVAPYDIAPLSLIWRAKIMIGYSILFMLCYAAIAYLQSLVFKKVKVWNVWLELITISVVFVIFLPSSFWYYKSPLILGEYSFYTYAPNMYLPSLPLIIPLLFLGRWIAAKWGDRRQVLTHDYCVITGENKLDVLRIRISDLVCIIAANNYIEVNYLNTGGLQKKLMRTSLTKVQELIPELIRTHRSYLINTSHFVEWEDGNTLELYHIKVPVSRNYKTAVVASLATRP